MLDRAESGFDRGNWRNAAWNEIPERTISQFIGPAGDGRGNRGDRDANVWSDPDFAVGFSSSLAPWRLSKAVKKPFPPQTSQYGSSPSQVARLRIFLSHCKRIK